MPTYQYACTECEHAFEQVQSFSEDSLTECPQCQGRLRKLFNAVGVVFKGSGFYRTDSRADARGSSGTNGSSSEGASGSDKKPAAEKKTADSSSGSSSTGTKSGTSGSSSTGGSSSGSSSKTAAAASS